MGAYDFYHSERGKSAREAFDTAHKQACWEYGHGGYTGTIAEKGSFVMIPLPEGKDAMSHAQELIDSGDHRVDDKWGPAGCIEIPNSEKEGTKNYLFFGWASS
jgi:hypothetical protein